MADTEWWQRGPVDGIADVLQPIAHALLQVRESAGEMVEGLTEAECDFRAVGRAKLPSTVIGCMGHAAEHAMRHIGQLSVTSRIVGGK